MEKMTIEQVRDLCEILCDMDMGDQGFRYWNFDEEPREVMGIISMRIYNKDGKSWAVFHGDD